MSYTLVESREVKGELVVREVPDADEAIVRRWRGRLFATVVEAEAFLETQMLFPYLHTWSSRWRRLMGDVA